MPFNYRIGKYDSFREKHSPSSIF